MGIERRADIIIKDISVAESIHYSLLMGIVKRQYKTTIINNWSDKYGKQPKRISFTDDVYEGNS